MPPLSLPALQSGKPTAWEEAIYAFLVEKRARSGSTRTVESYARGMPVVAALWLVISIARSTRSYTPIATATSGHVRSVSRPR